ncbi:MAG: hypothetical protein Q9174_003737 [Haloplaca sp. 1 TL-2023]
MELPVLELVVVRRGDVPPASLPLHNQQVEGLEAPHRVSVADSGRSRTNADLSAVLEKKYTKDHEWVELNEDKTEGTIGITHYAASALGEVVYVELPEQDLEVTAGDSMGAVESVKSANDIMTPVTGKVIATNEKLQEKPSMINKGPEAEGWIARLKIGDAKEVDGLMDLEAYRKHTEE